MTRLGPEDFPAFFAAVHGRAPFAWQARLCETVMREGWPGTIAAPTGTGKTAVIDIAVFHLAAEAGTEQRRAPLRIVLAVDRRVVVDQAFDRARHLRDTLAHSEMPILAAVSAALRRFGGSPLHVEQLRGGLPREDDWALTPAQPTVLCTTIDQLGSRLLFRGYGVSPSMAPVHAGLLGEDALILLDEAHLSRAFRDTLDGVARQRARREEMSVARPWAACALTATPAPTTTVFRLSDDERAEPAIARRLRAAKPARLVLLSTDATAEIVSAYAEMARDLAGRCRRASPVIAIVVNRVRLARLIHAALHEDETGTSAILLTGRVRPVERDALIEAHGDRLFAGNDEREGGPLFVVATQCVEAGADFDFDALVSQIAPLDALRQRFGRLNRLGEVETASAIVVATKSEVAARAQDPVYEDRLRATWSWLKEKATRGPRRGDPETVDFGIEALDGLLAATITGTEALASPALPAPLLRQPDVAFFAMTNPTPDPDIALPLYLRGRIDVSADARLVWRADLTEADLADPERAIAIVEAMPPRPGEAMSVPVWAARAWLKDRGSADEMPDLDMTGSAESGEGREGPAFVRWRRDSAHPTAVERASGLRPGDLLALPAELGGCDAFGWAPDATEPVSDVADLAAKPYREARRAVLRLHPAIWPGEDWRVLAALVATAEPGRAREFVDSAIEATEANEGLVNELRSFRSAKQLRIETPYDEAEERRGLLLVAPTGLSDKGDPRGASGEATTDDDDRGSYAGAGPQTLADHTRSVENWASGFVTRLRLPERLARSVALAAALHDGGKSDPRFQHYLTGGELSDEPLAKSGNTPRGPADVAARRASGLPARWRHEALSVRMAMEGLRGREDVDADLVLFLIGTHHGQGRPFFRHEDPWDETDRPDLPPGAGPERLDFAWNDLAWAELFDLLRRRYGTWGLAWLEAVLRLADHRASEAGR